MKWSLKLRRKTSSSFNCHGIYSAETDTKERRCASAKALEFVDCEGEFRTLGITLNLVDN